MLEIGNKWIYDTRDYSVGGGFYEESIDSMVIVGDTLIDGKMYFELWAGFNDPCNYIQNGFLREEDDKVFLYEPTINQENMMVDMAATEPYEISFYSHLFDSIINSTIIVDSTGIEVMPNGKELDLIYHRIVNEVSYGEAVHKYSREIGYISYSNLYPHLGTGVFCDGSDELNFRCFISGVDTINVTERGCYESSINVHTLDVDIEEIILRPNPIRGEIILPGDYDEVFIYDTYGSKYKSDIQNGVIDISNFPKGLYYIILKKEGYKRVVKSKVIKI